MPVINVDFVEGLLEPEGTFRAAQQPVRAANAAIKVCQFSVLANRKAAGLFDAASTVP